MPCALGPVFDAATPADQLAMMKATKWADNLTNAEWPVMLQDVSNPPVKSRMKKKIVGWIMILTRIMVLNPVLFHEAMVAANDLYTKQTGEQNPLVTMYCLDLLVRSNKESGDYDGE